MMNGRKYFRNLCKDNNGLVWLINQLMTKSAHGIIVILMLINYIYNMIFGWVTENKNIIDIIITHKNWTVVWLFDYFWNECENNKMLVQSIDQLNIESVHGIIKKLVSIAYISNMIFVLLLEDKYIVYKIIVYNYWTEIWSFNYY